jgi:hypothetical protein
MYKFDSTATNTELSLTTSKLTPISDFFKSDTTDQEFHNIVEANEGDITFIPNNDLQAQLLVRNLVKKYYTSKGIDINELDFTHIIGGKDSETYNTTTNGVLQSYDLKLVPSITQANGLSSGATYVANNLYYVELTTPYLEKTLSGPTEVLSQKKQRLIFVATQISGAYSLQCLGMSTSTPILSDTSLLQAVDLQTPKIPSVATTGSDPIQIGVALKVYDAKGSDTTTTLTLKPFDSTSQDQNYNCITKQQDLHPVDEPEVASAGGTPTSYSGGFTITVAQYSSIYSGTSDYKVGSADAIHHLSLKFSQKVSLKDKVFGQGNQVVGSTEYFNMVYNRSPSDALYGKMPSVTK